MGRRYGKFGYWCVEFTDPNGLTMQAGNETSFTGIVLWAQKNLDKLPKGEGKFVRKSVRNG